MDSISILLMDKRLFTLNDGVSGRWNDAVAGEILGAFDPVGNRDQWFPIVRRDALTGDPGAMSFLMGKRINNYTYGAEQSIGYVLVGLSDRQISALFQSRETPEEKGHYVVTRDGRVVACTDRAQLNTGVEAVNLALEAGGSQVAVKDGEQERFVTITPIQGSELLLASVRSAAPIRAAALRLTATSVFFLLLLLAAILSLLGVVIRHITRSIARLSKEMGRVREGDFSEMPRIASGDEIEQLTDSFNRMLSDINRLYHQLQLSERQNAQAQLALMQSQIQPHFMYNTLDLIYVLNSMEQTGRAATTVKALADFYRSALADGESFVSIDRELELVENYLRLQHVRFSELFDYTVAVEEEIHVFKIPRLTLQPIVENAIQHGVRQSGRKGLVSLTGTLSGGDILLEICDNGAGMGEERLEDIRRSFSGAGPTGSFGLLNTSRRLKLCFGEPYGLHIDSAPGLGTRVAVRIPARVTIDRLFLQTSVTHTAGCQPAPLHRTADG